MWGAGRVVDRGKGGLHSDGCGGGRRPLASLVKSFPDGVCDYSRPGVGKQDTVEWLTYQDCHGKASYGGEPLGTAPPQSGDGWNSRAFDGWRLAGTRGDLGTCGLVHTGDDGDGAGGLAGGSGGGSAGRKTPNAPKGQPAETTG